MKKILPIRTEYFSEITLPRMVLNDNNLSNFIKYDSNVVQKQSRRSDGSMHYLEGILIINRQEKNYVMSFDSGKSRVVPNSRCREYDVTLEIKEKLFERIKRFLEI